METTQDKEAEFVPVDTHQRLDDVEEYARRVERSNMGGLTYSGRLIVSLVAEIRRLRRQR